jgi:hypothetical protein
MIDLEQLTMGVEPGRRPWHLRLTDEDVLEVFTEDMEPVCLFYEIMDDDDGMDRDQAAFDVSNGKLVVKAVNSYHEMLRALKIARKQLDHMERSKTSTTPAPILSELDRVIGYAEEDVEVETWEGETI